MEIKVADLDIPQFLYDIVLNNPHLLDELIQHLHDVKTQAMNELLTGNISGSNYEDGKLRVHFFRSKYSSADELIKKYENVKKERFSAVRT